MNDVIITAEDYFEITGVNLTSTLAQILISDNPSKICEITINEVKDWLIDYLVANYDNDGTLTTEKQRQAFKKAVIWQLAYMLAEDDLTNKSGFNPESGLITNIDGIRLAPKNKAILRNVGLLNFVRW